MGIKEERITIRVEKSDIDKTIKLIKTYYPELKNFSHIYREALRFYYKHKMGDEAK